VSKIVENQTTGRQIFNVTANAVSMKEIVNVITENLNKKLPRLAISPTILRFIFQLNKKTVSLNKIKAVEKNVEKWLADDIYSGDKISEIYNFTSATTIAEAIEKEVNNFKKV
jgi:nucleoside-diphosphate-sugar epimerase